MTQGLSCANSFNRVLRLFRDDLTRPEYRVKNEALRAVTARLERLGLPVRLDFAREWENAHVLLELDRLRAAAPVRTILEVGGGNSPICHHLAEQGLEVVVLDIDGRMMTRVNENSRVLGWEGRLRGVH